MTTYIIGLLVVVMFYGLAWNNRSARSYPPVSPDVDNGTTRTGQQSDSGGAVKTPHPILIGRRN